MHTDFVNLSATTRNDALLKTEALFVDQKLKWVSDFTRHFESICAEIVRRQTESSLFATSRLEVTMLYTNFIYRRYVAEVWVYDNQRYLDKKQRLIGELDISFLFIYFNELWDKLLSARKSYAGKVTAREIASFY